MVSFSYENKTYNLDEKGFLENFDQWDENFARGMAQKFNIAGNLTSEHMDIINYIRKTFKETGRCPLVYETCRMNGLRIKELKRLFPSGYLRGACRLAGITYKEGYLGQSYLPKTADDLNTIAVNMTYEVDARGFLVDPHDWNEYYAVFRAHEMKIPGGKLNDRHWQVIKYLRDYFEKNSEVPTVYQTCEANGMELEELEKLFPDGYHRGVVKIAGLRVR